jgi:hypothetical protein
MGDRADVKNKVPSRIGTTDEEIEAAIERGKIYMQNPLRPRALAVVYLPQEDKIVLTLPTGAELAIPRKLLQGLTDADPAEVAKFELEADGAALHWESLDVDHYIPALMDGYFGNDRWMSELGKRGGASRSEAKQSAARKNGRKGGRPKILRRA